MPQNIQELLPILKEIKDYQLKALVKQIIFEFLDSSPWTNFTDVPFNVELPQYKLVDHINNVTETTWYLAQLVKARYGISIDTDLLIAAGVLHDLSKLVEYEPDGKGGVRKSETGRRLAHSLPLLGYLMNRGDVPLPLIHNIVTHTPNSTMYPQDLEGMILRHIDITDANILRVSNNLELIMERR